MHSTSNKLPPCIVLGLETQIGLSIVRELGRAGVPVIGIAQEFNAIGLKSRYLARGLVTKKPRSVELIEEIRALGEELGDCCLIAVSEANLIWLASNRNEFGKVKPILPPQAALDIVLDKQRTMQAAQSLGITVPETAEPTSMREVEELAGRFQFPVVLKWKNPNVVMQDLGRHGIQLVKAEYAYSSQEFLDIARRYLPAGKWPLVQEYCPGVGLGQFFYMHAGKAIRRFQHIRIAEWPPEGGFSSVCDAIPLGEHTDLQEQSISLLQAIGWQGVAMVEYRFDPNTGRAVLMEINGRYWGSYPLAMHSGANFSLISYSLESGLGIPTLHHACEEIRCRMVVTELKRLWRLWFQSHLIADRSFKIKRISESFRFIRDFFRPRVFYYVWDGDDPGPFVEDMRNLFRRLRSR
jgi:predicted ATP-grasp superfamily ATP-dependent carboligase